MSEVKWIKIKTTMFDDEKIKLIESMPEKDTILIVWIKLLALCGKCNQDGKILLTGDIAYTDEMLSSIFNRQVSSIRLAIDVFKSLQMIEIDNGIINITNWYKHQNLQGLDKIREQNRERQRIRREKHQKDEQYIDDSINTIIDSNINKDISSIENTKIKIKNKNKTCHVTVTLHNVTAYFNNLWSKYPNKLGKKQAERHFIATVKGEKDLIDINKALDNFLRSPKCEDPKFIPHGSTWFNNWHDWVEYQTPEAKKTDEDGIPLDWRTKK
jgi:predicted phage replisome organizer